MVLLWCGIMGVLRKCDCGIMVLDWCSDGCITTVLRWYYDSIIVVLWQPLVVLYGGITVVILWYSVGIMVVLW